LLQGIDPIASAALNVFDAQITPSLTNDERSKAQSSRSLELTGGIAFGS